LYRELDTKLIVQNNAEEATLNCQPAVVAVVDKAQVPELVHEMADPRAGGTHHLCQVVLADSGKNRCGPAFLPKMGQQ
jgi:hypothetical protein